MGRRTVDDTWHPPHAAERINAILKAVKRTPAQFANVLGVSRQTMHGWLTSKYVPQRTVCEKLEKLEKQLSLRGDGDGG